MQGVVVSIHIARHAGSRLVAVPEAQLVAGRGILGDRYHDGAGEFSPATPDPDHELTLIASEEIARFNAESGLRLSPGEFRRNVVTRGVALNDLIGREFALGEVLVRGIRLCEPCAYLARLTGREILDGMVHRAGLRAGIVRSGRLLVGDGVETIVTSRSGDAAR
jgi:MOSC domain-containing protein YiiM